MTETTAETIRRLLDPQCDVSRWTEDVAALDAGKAVPILVRILHDDRQPLIVRAQAIMIPSFASKGSKLASVSRVPTYGAPSEPAWP